MTTILAETKNPFLFFQFRELEIELALKIISSAYYEVAMKQTIPSLGEVVELCQALYHSALLDIARKPQYPITPDEALEQHAAECLGVETTALHQFFQADVHYMLKQLLRFSFLDGHSLEHRHSKRNVRERLQNHYVVEVW